MSGHRWLLGWVVLSLGSGCAVTSRLGASVGIGALSREEVDAAIQAEDYPQLKGVCDEQIAVKGSANVWGDACKASYRLAAAKDEEYGYLKAHCAKRDKLFGATFAEACKGVMQQADRRDDRAQLTLMCGQEKQPDACRKLAFKTKFSDLAKPDCSTLAQRFAKAREGDFDPYKATSTDIAPIAAALVRCKESGLLFEELIRPGGPGPNTFGTQLLLETEKEVGGELLALLESYLVKNTGAQFLKGEFGHLAGNHLSHWLVQTQRTQLCEPLVKAARGANPGVLFELAYYFWETGCKASAPLGVELLSSETGEHRQGGCQLLERYGDASHLSRLAIVAQNDTAYRVVERPADSGVYVKEFFVADACRQAIGKIRLRTE
ncbi:hypothetical protein LZ198_08665 [Myxococcus sp. K15C18031901]|uniref:hypothetical protein n=1 Tax=Myxococcus dinghuensis TaxID=2906761 RepID=UPI0020A73226|nr:hypothetical protein [Myxococcus dinghuensis]MCP3098947.1 hypothetical protein [Myxococcus dinghuensis]